MRRRESSITLSNILLLLLVFLFVSEVQARKPQPECSSSCGDLKNISYPFWLKGDPKQCGVPELELSCQSNKAILQFDSRKYYVEEINDYGWADPQKYIRVVDVNLASGNCSLPTQSLSVTEPLYYDDRTGKRFGTCSFCRVGTAIQRYTDAKFFNCSSNFTHPAYIRVPCLSGNQSQVYLNYDSNANSDLPRSCSLISIVPVLLGIETRPSYETIQKLLQSGFYLNF